MHECAVRRSVGPVGLVGLVGLNWCAARRDWGLAVCLAGWCAARHEACYKSRLALYDNIKRAAVYLYRFQQPLLAQENQKLLGNNKFVGLGFLAGSAIGRDDTDLGSLVQTADKGTAEFIDLSIASFNSGAQFLFQSFELTESGTVAEISFSAGPQTFGSLF